jgi:hypothetical protein
MAKKKNVSESEIKAAISAVRDRKRRDIAKLRPSDSAPVFSLRRKLGERLQPVFAEAGLDIQKINKILEKDQSALRSALEKEKSKSAKAFSALNTTDLRRGIENQARALRHIESNPLTITPITLWTALGIDPSPDFAIDKNRGPANNWARFSFYDENDGDYNASVTFTFFWQNQSHYLAVFNATSSLVAHGTVTAHSRPNVLSGGDASITMDAVFTVHVGTADIGSSVQMESVEAASQPQLFGGGEGKYRSVGLTGTYPLPTISMVSLDSFEVALFEVSLRAHYSISGGDILLDFLRRTGPCPPELLRLRRYQWPWRRCKRHRSAFHGRRIHDDSSNCFGRSGRYS